MVKADKRVMAALLSPDGQIITKFLEKCLDDKVDLCLESSGESVYRAQGAALELKDLVKLAQNSSNVLKST